MTPALVKRGGPLSGPQKIPQRRARRRLFSPRFILGRFLVIVLFALLAGTIWKTYSAWQGRLWQSGRLTVVVATTNPTVYSVDPDQNSLTILEIPANTQVTAARGLGEWLVGSLGPLGQQEKLGGELLARSLQKSFGLPAQGWLAEWGSFVGETNLTFFDRLKLFQTVSRIGEADQTRLDAEALRVIREETLADGTAGFRVIPEQAKLIFEKEFRDDRVFSENLTVTIVNVTETRGLATDVSRLLSVLGARIIALETQKQAVRNCQVVGRKIELGSNTARKIAALLGCEPRVGEPRRSHLEVWLGEEFAKRF